MSINISSKVIAEVLNDNANTYYSDPQFNAALGAAEKYFVQMKASNVTGTTPTITVSLETSNDGVNWTVRNAGIINGFSIAGGATTTGSELGTGAVGGRFARIGAKLGGTTPNAYIEIWVTGRDAM